jgi:hypothetical protein
VGKDDRALAMVLGKRRQCRAEAADAGAGVDQDGHACRGGHPEQLPDARVIEGERLRPGVQLEPARPGSQRRGGVAGGADLRIEASKGNQAVRVALALLDDAAVLRLIATRHAEGKDHRLPVQRLELADVVLARAGAAVDVGARMCMGIERSDLACSEGLQLGLDFSVDAQPAYPAGRRLASGLPVNSRRMNASLCIGQSIAIWAANANARTTPSPQARPLLLALRFLACAMRRYSVAGVRFASGCHPDLSGEPTFSFTAMAAVRSRAPQAIHRALGGLAYCFRCPLQPLGGPGSISWRSERGEARHLAPDYKPNHRRLKL